MVDSPELAGGTPVELCPDTDDSTLEAEPPVEVVSCELTTLVVVEGEEKEKEEEKEEEKEDCPPPDGLGVER